jgi:hypothetical protein
VFVFVELTLTRDDTNGAPRGFFVYWPEGEMATFTNSDFVQMASLMGDEKAKESFSQISQGCAWNPLAGASTHTLLSLNSSLTTTVKTTLLPQLSLKSSE